MNLTKTQKLQLLKADGKLKKNIVQALQVVKYSKNNKYYTDTWKGTARHKTLQSYSANVSLVLSLLGYKFSYNNDAPRGGAEGNYIKSSKSATNKIELLLKQYS